MGAPTASRLQRDRAPRREIEERGGRRPCRPGDCRCSIPRRRYWRRAHIGRPMRRNAALDQAALHLVERPDVAPPVVREPRVGTPAIGRLRRAAIHAEHAGSRIPARARRRWRPGQPNRTGPPPGSSITSISRASAEPAPPGDWLLAAPLGLVDIAVIGSMVVRTSGHLLAGKPLDLGMLVHQLLVLGQVDAEGLVVDDHRLHPLHLAAELRQGGVRQSPRRPSTAPRSAPAAGISRSITNRFIDLTPYLVRGARKPRRKTWTRVQDDVTDNL